MPLSSDVLSNKGPRVHNCVRLIFFLKCNFISCNMQINYQPRGLVKQGDNALGTVRLSVHPSPLSRPNRLTYDLDIWYVG